MKTIPAIKKKWNISRVPATQFYKPKNLPIAYEKASVIARMLNASIDNTLTVDDVLSNFKNFVYATHRENVGEIVGAAHFKRRDWENCDVKNIIVLENYRRQGYGKTIMSEIEKRASYRDFKYINVTIDDKNEAVSTLLEKSGYSKSLSYFDENTKQNMAQWLKEVPKPERKKKKPVMK